MLYEPLLEEIQPLMQRAAPRWPHLASRVAKAEQLLVERNLTAGATWMVYSQSGQGCYTVHTDPTQRGCTCYDYDSGRAVRRRAQILQTPDRCQRLCRNYPLPLAGAHPGQ